MALPPKNDFWNLWLSSIEIYLEENNKEEILYQHFSDGESIQASCIWDYSTLENCLLKKHKRTVWINAEQRFDDNKWQYKYVGFNYSEKPSFNQFLSLIPLNQTQEIVSLFLALGGLV